MATLMPFWDQQFFDGNGNPLAGGKIYAYESGTTNAKDTYTSYAGTTKQTHPVILDAAGRTTIWLAPGAYTLLLTDKDGVTIKTLDNVNASSTTQNGYIDPRDYGAVGDGTTDDYDAFVAANNAALAATLPIRVSAGNYQLDSNPTISVLMILEPYAKFEYTGFNPSWTVQIDSEDRTTHFDSTVPVANVPTLAGIDIARPEWFGAAANGSTDDTNAIQKAVNCFSNGGVVKFAQKTYKITSAIALKAKTTIEGSGKNTTTINNTSTTANGLTFAAGYSNLCIKNLLLATSGASTGDAISIGSSAVNVTISGVVITGYTNGIVGGDMVISDCKLTGKNSSTGAGITVNDTGAGGIDSTISGVEITNYLNGIVTTADFGYTANGISFTTCGTNTKLIGPYSVLNKGSLELTNTSGDSWAILETHSGTITDSAKIDFIKSATTDETTGETANNETIGIIRAYAANSSDAKVLTNSIEFKQDGAAGASYVKTDVEISCGSDAAGPGVVAKVEYPGTTNNTALSIDHYDGSTHELKVVSAGGIGSGGAGYRALRVAEDSAETAADASSIPMWVKKTIGHAAVAALGASPGGSIAAFAIPAGGVIHGAIIHHTEAFSGTSITAMTVSLGVTGDTNEVANPFDIFSAVTTSNAQHTISNYLVNTGSGYNLNARFLATGANLSAVVAGSVDIWILVSKVISS